jgi:hypothetical protein
MSRLKSVLLSSESVWPKGIYHYSVGNRTPASVVIFFTKMYVRIRVLILVTRSQCVIFRVWWVSSGESHWARSETVDVIENRFIGLSSLGHN